MKKIFLGAIFILILLIFPCNANGKHDKFAVGINFGFTFPFARDYYEGISYDSESRWESTYGFRAGLNLNYFFSHRLAIQLEMDYQRKVFNEEFKDYNFPEYNYSYSENLSFYVYYLNIIYIMTDSSKNNLSPYVFAGLGIEDIDPIVLYSKMGGGIQFPLSSKIIMHTGLSLFGPATKLYTKSFTFQPFNIKYFSVIVGLRYMF